MFLRPHHFQQWDLYAESRSAELLHALSAEPWGLMHLELDEAALDNFTLAVTSLKALLPDGTLVDVPGNARLPSRDLSERMGEAGKLMPVTLGVRRREGRAAQTGESAEAGQARFVAAEEEVYDFDTGESPASVELLELELRFFLGEEPTDGYEVLPLLRLQRSGNPAKPVLVDKSFAPPVVWIGSSDVLAGSARAVLERLAVTLRAMRSTQKSQDPQHLTLFQALSAAMPVLQDMLREGDVAPRLVYRELARLAGGLLFRDESGREHDCIPAYSHRDPAPVFGALRALIEELSEPVIQRQWTRVPLVRDGDLFRGALPPEAKEPGARFLVEAEADASTPQLRTLMLAAKISSPARIDTLRGHALPGVMTEALPGAPPELPPGQTGQYFRLKNEEAEWGAHVAGAGELAAFLLGAPEDVTLNLIVVLPG